MKHVVAVDIGGTDIKSALVNENFEVLTTTSTPTPKPDPTGAETLDVIAEIVAGFSKENTIAAVGLGVLGVFDDALGICRWSGNLQWRDFPIRDLLQSRLGLPVAAGHDIRTAGLAEARDGAAAGYANSIFIAIGTGIAASLVIDGEIRSSSGFAGEIGHVNVSGKFNCVCGRNGCLEAASSALSISNAYNKAAGTRGVTTEAIAQLVRDGDPIANEIWSDAMQALARACEMLITILAPEAIIFGGGLAKSANLLLNPISEALDEALTFQRKPELKIARYGALAGTIGCAMMAFDLVNRK